MTRRFGLGALFAALVTVSVALGAATPLPTASVWRDNVWTTAKVTTRTASTHTYAGSLVPGPDTGFASEPAWTLNTVNPACVSLNVTTTSTTPVKWSVRLDTLAQPWNGATTNYQLRYGYVISDGVTDGQYKTISGNPTSSPPRDTIVKGTVLTVQVCNYQAGAPPIGDASWVQVNVSAPTKVTDAMVCKTVTAIALGKTQFWFRWRATVPTADMFAALGTKTSFWWTYSDYNVVKQPDPSPNPASPSTVVLTSATNDTTSLLKDTLRFDYTLCLNGS